MNQLFQAKVISSFFNDFLNVDHLKSLLNLLKILLLVYVLVFLATRLVGS